MRGKEHYDKPETAMARLELESPICSGSVEMTAKSPGVETTAQKVNTDFATDNNFSTGTDWDAGSSN